MYSRSLEQIADQRPRELRPPAGLGRPDSRARARGRPLRWRTGWALVWIGLRLAESGSR